jgi:N-acyl-D-amino-acid deacylase
MNTLDSRTHDVLIRNGMIYDGSGEAPFEGDVAIDGDAITWVGPAGGAHGRVEVDAGGLAVAPGFINMLSQSSETFLVDGRSQSDLRQGVTLEVLGESLSFGPLNDMMKGWLTELQGDLKFDIPWTTLGEYLEHLARRGVAANVASFVGSGTLRVHVLGFENRAARPDELEQMCALARQAMAEGALGLSSALIYVPDCFNRTEELIALARAAGEYGGLYITHMRSEGDRVLEGLDEALTIARQAGIRTEIYHLKVAGQANWPKLDALIARVEAARAQGLQITADMYPYTAGMSGLDASMPHWVQEGGHRAWVERLKDPGVRVRVRQEIATPSNTWENLYLLSGSAENVLFVGFKNESLKPLTGETLAEVAALRGKSPEETMIDLVVEDDSRVMTAYFSIAEDNIRREIALPWVSFGSDAESAAPEGVFLKSSTHPRAYGTFARLLGYYVRDEKIVPLQEAVRRLTTLPASNLGLSRRGALKPGCLADVVVFDPANIRDHATYTQPQQYATGVQHVFVNGQQVLRDGEHTGLLPGRVVRGPGWKPERA